MNSRLRPGTLIHYSETDVAEERRKRRGAVGEQPIEPVGRKPHRHGCRSAASADSAFENIGSARIEAEAGGVDDHFGERGDILQAHIEPLAGNRMNNVRGVADQCQALGDKRPRHVKPKGMNAARADRRNVAEMQLKSLLKLGMEGVSGQRDDALRLAGCLSPDNRRALTLERQDGERSRRQKVLLRPAVVIAFVIDIDDDRRLTILPAMHGYAGALADRRMSAIGRDQQTCRDRTAIGQLDVET